MTNMGSVIHIINGGGDEKGLGGSHKNNAKTEKNRPSL
jgi:hypothetical protein